jgi:hypothetical protein
MIGPPNDTPEYAYPAWASALRAAAREPGAFDAFTRDTGFIYSLPKSPIDALIDQSTGLEEAFMDAFVTWFNNKVWGPWNEPEGDIWGDKT